MKKIISLLLTAVMVFGVVAAIPVTAEGENWAMYYDFAGADPGHGWFMNSYCYSENGSDTIHPYVQRVKDPTSPYYGGFDYTLLFDINVEDYGVVDDEISGLTFTHLFGSYHVGYSFSEAAFVIYRMYMPGSGTDSVEFNMLASMSYELNKGQWYEMAIQWNGYVVRLYLDGVLMLEFDFASLETAENERDRKVFTDWRWESMNKPENITNDRLWLEAVDCSIYMDNIAIYSGDYSFATGTATTTHFAMDGDFAYASTPDDGVDDMFGIWTQSNFQKVPYGTEKVTYDREWAVSHEHNLVHDEANSTTAHCLNDGYDLWVCECGASEKKNYVAALGHLPGFTKDTIVAATEDTNGVDVRMCNREGCYKTYTTEIPLTGSGKALHMISDGGTSLFNGYAGIHDKQLMIQDDGITVSMDIMAVEHADKPKAAIYAQIGGCDLTVYLGYSFALGKFVATTTTDFGKATEADILDTSDYVLDMFAWNEWTWVRDGYYAYLYINGEEVLTAYLGDYTYDLDGPDNDKDNTIDDTQFFLIQTPCTELYIDNVVVASPDYDIEHQTGVVYEYTDLNDGVSIDGYSISLSDANALILYGWTKDNKAGYQLDSYGRPMEAVTQIHRDMAMKIDTDYTTGSVDGYSQLWAEDSDDDDAINYNDYLVDNDIAGLDFEYSFDFYAYDWCTDATLMGDKSAMIGGTISSETNNNGFIGYDFIKQQAVIGSTAAHSGGAYGADNVYADYKIEMNTWHSFSFKYSFDPTLGEVDSITGEPYGEYVLSISIDGKEVLSYNTDYLNVSYYILFPTFVKGYLDNLTIRMGDVYYDNANDLNNGYGVETGGFDFGGTAWSRADGGIPVHTYTREVYPASCETDGYTVMTCACGNGGNYVLYDQEAQGHAWGAGVVTTEPTEEAEGVMTYTCSVCGETKTEAIAKLEPEYLPGDVNGDGRIAVSDTALLGRSLAGAKLDFNSNAADVNVDGRVATTDLNYIRRRLGGANIVLG